jgi:hypothetical protein
MYFTKRCKITGDFLTHIGTDDWALTRNLKGRMRTEMIQTNGRQDNERMKHEDEKRKQQFVFILTVIVVGFGLPRALFICSLSLHGI